MSEGTFHRRTQPQQRDISDIRGVRADIERALHQIRQVNIRIESMSPQMIKVVRSKNMMVPPIGVDVHPKIEGWGA